MEMTVKHPIMLTVALLCSGAALADGTVVDTVYDPYVNALEKEVEYRLVRTQGGRSLHRLGIASSLTDRLAVEVYGLSEDSRMGTLEGGELEFKYQLTEQGEYFADVGVLAEYEYEDADHNNEGSLTLLAASAWGAHVSAANLSLGYENRGALADEWETSLSLQTRYRLRQWLEPGVEFYAGEDYRGIGPVLVGTTRLGVAKSLRWEIGAIAGLTDDSADYTLRLSFEYEFY
ncbi:hypothetical protein IMCC21906_03193 [Spongiibacter sp. IMCC21906]|nr:hypothetical protein IMCC21906_03193 [Spongiibacter sp. IMCC21906]